VSTAVNSNLGSDSSSSVTFADLQAALSTEAAEASHLRIPKATVTDQLNATATGAHAVEMVGGDQIKRLQLAPNNEPGEAFAYQMLDLPGQGTGERIFYEVMNISRYSLTDSTNVSALLESGLSQEYHKLPKSNGFMGFNLWGYWQYVSNAFWVATLGGGIKLQALNTGHSADGDPIQNGGSGRIKLEAQDSVVIEVGSGGSATDKGATAVFMSDGSNPPTLTLDNTALTSLIDMIDRYEGNGNFKMS